MCLEYFRPGTLVGPKGDDAYVRKVFAVGDTTDQHSSNQSLLRLMELSHTLVIIFLLMTLIRILLLENLLLLVSFTGVLYLLLLVGTWL
jgi:hypothetical protein